MGDEPTTSRQGLRGSSGSGMRARRSAALAGRNGKRLVGERETAVGLLARMGHRLAGLGWRLLLTLIVLAVVALPPLVVWAFVDSDAWAAVGGIWAGICVGAAVVWMSAGTDYSGDY